MARDVPRILNWIDGRESVPDGVAWLEKYNPHTGELLCRVADSSAKDVGCAITAAESAFRVWSETTPVKRGQVLAGLDGPECEHIREPVVVGR